MSQSRDRWRSVRTLLADAAVLASIQLAVAAALRFLWMARPDPFGQRVVGKLEWYFFHALALDAWQNARLCLVLVPFLVAAVARPQYLEALRRWSANWFSGWLVVATLLAVIDQEVSRGVGSHLNARLLSTYANLAQIQELPALTASDKGGPYLGLILLVLAPALCVFLLRRTMRKRLQAPEPSAKPLVRFAAFTASGCLYAFVLWPGAFRERRLAAPLDVLLEMNRGTATRPLSPAQVRQATTDYQTRWLSEQATPARFPSSTRPLLHLSAHALCALREPLGSPPAPACSEDQDRDGVPLRQDCDDANAAIHPGMSDEPGNGVDEDCSGIDEAPWNVVLFILETHRAIDVGYIHPERTPSATPRLDALAHEGLALTRATANGVPTIASFMTIQTGLLGHPNVFVASGFCHLDLPSLPRTLGQYGYYRRFFSAADPGWDNETPWLARWYDEVDYSRSRETDRLLFDHIGDWFENEWPKIEAGGKTKSFFVAAMTRSNHYPFHRIEGVRTTGDDSLPAKIRDTMYYTDEAMGRLIDRIRALPIGARTLFVVTGDHGFPLGEHPYLHLADSVFAESVRVPIVIAGPHPELVAHKGLVDRAAGHIDIAPTVLDLLGIPDDGQWMGHSLLTAGDRTNFVFTPLQVSAENNTHRLIYKRSEAGTPVASAPKIAFDRNRDPWENHPLEDSVDTRGLQREVTTMEPWMQSIYDNSLVGDGAPVWRAEVR